MFDQELLRTFVRIIEAGSFAAAAGQVGRTPSAVSMQVKRLEEAAGRRLLVRSTKGVALTAEGETLLLHARQILDAHAAAFDAMMGARAEESLSIGLPDTYLQTVLQPHLADFVRAFPKTGLHVIGGGSGELLRRFNEGALHIALFTEYQLGDERGEIVYREHGAWACARNTTVLERNPLPLALAFEGSLYRRLAQDFFRRERRPYRVALASNRQHAVQAAIEAGAAVGLLPATWISPAMRELKSDEGFPGVPPLIVRMRMSKRLPEAGAWLAGRIQAAAETRAHAFQEHA